MPLPFTISSISTSRSTIELKLQSDWEAIAKRIITLAGEVPEDVESKTGEQMSWMRRWSALMVRGSF